MLGVTTGQHTMFDVDESAASGVQAVVDWYGPSDFLLMDLQFREGPPQGEGPPVMVHDDPDSPESRFLGAPIQEVPELTRQANPISYIVTSPSLAPFFLAAGTNDRLVPYQQTTVLAEALRRHAGQVELHVLKGALHADRRFEEEMTAPAISWLAGLRTRAT